jgi:amino acid transporter
MSMDKYTEKDHHEDVKVLHGMGYAQELSRSMSKFSNFAISFSIICILSGGINSFAQAISSVGGAGAGIGWIVGCIISGMFALSMAQIASAFPTAGGLYHWASILGSRFWGWLTAWLNLLGLITVLGAINIGTAYFFAGTFGPNFGFTGTDWQIVGFVSVITIAQAIFNHVGIKVTTFLTDISGYIIFATTAVLVLACLYFAPAIDVSRLWTFTNYSGEAGGNVFPQSDNVGYLFLLCLLLPVYTITGYDASAHTSEETKNAATSVPKGIVSAVLWSSLVGWIMICAITLAIPDMNAAAAQGWGMFFGTMDAIMPASLKLGLYFFILIAQFLCGLATVTSASRMLFAFSRDDGVPGVSKALATVSPKYRTPIDTVLVCRCDMQGPADRQALPGRVLPRRPTDRRHRRDAWLRLSARQRHRHGAGARLRGGQLGQGLWRFRHEARPVDADEAIPWLEKHGAHPCRLVDHHHHEDLPHSPRAILKAQVARLEKLG